MSEGFSNPIIGGGGDLVYPSIHSPDFVHDVSGWSINKDGTAEFQSVTALGTITSDVAGQLAELTGGEVNVTNTFDTNPGSLSATSGTAGLVQIFSPQTGAADVPAVLSCYSKNGHAGGPLFQVSDSVLATDPSSGAPESWHDTTSLLQSGWTAQDATGTIDNLKYTLSAVNDEVRLQGTIHQSSASPNDPILTLPTAYRPAKNHFLKVTNYNGATGVAAICEVATAGTISKPVPTPGNGVDVVFDCTFRLT